MNLTIAIQLLKMQGRINRTEFLAYFFMLNVFCLLILSPFYLATNEVFYVANTIIQLVFWVSFFLLSVCRVHDYNEKAWYAILSLLPIVNFFVIFASGEPVPNKYGPIRPNPDLTTKMVALSSFLLLVSISILLVNLQGD